MSEKLTLFSLISSILKLIIPFLAGFLTAIFAEPIRQLIFRPELKLDFGDSQDYLSLTPEELADRRRIRAYYIRIKVTNEKRIVAKDCKAYLVNIEKSDQFANFKPTVYCDSIPLAWSCQNKGEQYRGIDINKGFNQFLDIVTTREIADFFDPQIKLKPFRYEDIFKDRGRFRFTIQVTAANADPKTLQLIFEWTGVWDKFKVYRG